MHQCEIYFTHDRLGCITNKKKKINNIKGICILCIFVYDLFSVFFYLKLKRDIHKALKIMRKYYHTLLKICFLQISIKGTHTYKL